MPTIIEYIYYEITIGYKKELKRGYSKIDKPDYAMFSHCIENLVVF